MKPSPSFEPEDQDRELIELLKQLGTVGTAYPPELLAARRAAFLSQVQELRTVAFDEELSPEDQELVRLLGHLKSVQVEYPPDLLAARRAALLRRTERSAWEKFRTSLQTIFQSKSSVRTGTRLSMAIATLIAAWFFASLVFSRTEGALPPALQPIAESTQPLPVDPGEVAIAVCEPDDPTPSCPSKELDPSQDMANAGNGMAQPAVAKDARSNPDGVHKAAYVNDGRGGASWVSDSADSWIKIDLGSVRTIDTVRLQKGNTDPANEGNPGQFVIAVALSDFYSDGDSNNDSMEYTQVFHSEQASFSEQAARAETIETQFPPVKARFVKITFEKAGTAIEEVGVFLVRPPVLTQQPTGVASDDPLTIRSTPTAMGANTVSPTDSATSVPTVASTGTVLPVGTNTLLPQDTQTPLPTDTLVPPDTLTPVPTDPLPSDTPVPLPSVAPPAVQPSPASTGTILVTGNGQDLTFTCAGETVEIRGHANTVTLLGSCSSITVTGNENRVFWQFGSPVITNRGKDNIIQQL